MRRTLENNAMRLQGGQISHYQMFNSSFILHIVKMYLHVPVRNKTLPVRPANTQIVVDPPPVNGMLVDSLDSI